ncbi:unnamed protein product [Gordionus sp. m RMFG-2023]|uniref:uncharacterized protein LOC135923624 n=1 Tax=Gordionus sp. m RMFG-2023 TaxID=3053472 RepID=UPI0030E42B7B
MHIQEIFKSELKHVLNYNDETSEKIEFLTCENTNQISPFKLQLEENIFKNLFYNQFKKFVQFLTNVFLPKGYPESVSPDYLSYQIWDSVQAFCSSICGTLSTRAVLTGLGVGDPFATPLGATFNWIIKNGAGMLGGISFAVFAGERLDSNLKQWRLFADFVNDAALALEMMTPFFVSSLLLSKIWIFLKHINYLAFNFLLRYPILVILQAIAYIATNTCLAYRYGSGDNCTFLQLQLQKLSDSRKLMSFNPTNITSPSMDNVLGPRSIINWPLITLLCFSSVAQACVGVAGSATRAALVQHQSRASNIADVAAKDSSQETLVNLLALLASILFVLPLLDNNRLNKLCITWISFVFLISFHLYANYRAMKNINMVKVNARRYKSLVIAFLSQVGLETSPNKFFEKMRKFRNEKYHTMSPKFINKSESLWTGNDNFEYHYLAKDGGIKLSTLGWEHYVKMGIRFSDVITEQEFSICSNIYDVLKHATPDEFTAQNIEHSHYFNYVLVAKPFRQSCLTLNTLAILSLVIRLIFILPCMLFFQPLLHIYNAYSALHSSAKARDQLMALFQTECFYFFMAQKALKGENDPEPSTHKNNIINAIKTSATFTQKCFGDFYDICQEKYGWDFDTVLFNCGEWRFRIQ